MLRWSTTTKRRRRGAVAIAGAHLIFAACTSISPMQPDVPQGGRVLSIARPSQRPSEMLAASESGGLFRTVDGGATFRFVEGLPSFRMSDVAYAPDDPNVILVTFRQDFRIGPGSGVIWRSPDGGRSWSEPVNAQPPSDCGVPSAGYGISFQPGSRRVFVGTSCGVAVSPDLGATWTYEMPDHASGAEPPWSERFPAILAQASGRVLAVGQAGVFIRETRPRPGPGGPPTRTIQWRRTSERGISREGTIHGLAASPLAPDHLFVAGLDSATVTESMDGGNSWSDLPDPPIGPKSREAFVRAASTSSTAGSFFLYFGNGVRLFRQRIVELPGVSVHNPYEELALPHADPSDLLLDLDGRTPFVTSGDWGLSNTADGGLHWKFFGGGSHGLNALQIQDVAGQWIDASEGPRKHLYYAAQDNSIYASADDGATWKTAECCEGGHFQLAPRVARESDGHVTVLACSGDCVNKIGGALLSSVQPWSDAPNLDGSASPASVPIRLGNDGYLQSTTLAPDPMLDALRWTKSLGASWEPGAALLLPDFTAGSPLVVAENGGWTLLQPVARPSISWVGIAPSVMNGLSRAVFPGLTVSRIDSELGDLAVASYGLGMDRPVLAADPHTSGNLLAFDRSAQTVKFSAWGGTKWFDDAQLSQLVLQGGRYAFRQLADNIPLVSTIGWDPYNACHILVGTRQGGIYRSVDGGNSWAHVDGSEQIPDVSAFYFPPTGRIVVGSFGRGLWQLATDRTSTGCAARKVPSSAIEQFVLLDPSTGAPLKPDPAQPLPEGCTRCSTIVAWQGNVAGAEVAGGRLERFALGAGNPYQFGGGGAEEPLSVPNVLPSNIDARRVPELFARLRRERRLVRALVVRGQTLVALVVGPHDPAVRPSRVPVMRILSRAMPGGVATVGANEPYDVHAKGFVSSIAVEIVVYEEGSARGRFTATPDGAGSFHVTLRSTAGIGRRAVVVTQQAGNRLLGAAESFVVTGDVERRR